MGQAFGCFFACIVFVFMAINNMGHIGSHEAGYKEGYADCERVHNYYEMSPDDDLLMEELKGALKSYMKSNGLYERGDMKIIDKALDWKDYKDIAWNMTVRRKEIARGKK